MKTGFIGLGAMGKPMAKNLAASGLLSGVWNRTPTVAASVAKTLNCRHAESIADIGKYCDVLVLCVSADQDVLDVCAEVATAMKAGGVVIDCSTVSANTAREAADTLAASGIQFLDCPVSGGTEGAARGTLAIMAGGDREAFEQVLPVLEAMGGSVRLLGQVGAGQAAKATNQIMVAGINQAVTEALAFAEQQNLPIDDLIELLASGAAGSWFLRHRGPTMVRDEYPLGFKVDLHEKDLKICQEMAATLGVKLPIVEMTLLHYRRLLDAGYRDEDISSLHRLKVQAYDTDEP